MPKSTKQTKFMKIRDLFSKKNCHTKGQFNNATIKLRGMGKEGLFNYQIQRIQELYQTHLENIHNEPLVW